jgi:hypothetical protein
MGSRRDVESWLSCSSRTSCSKRAEYCHGQSVRQIGPKPIRVRVRDRIRYIT